MKKIIILGLLLVVLASCGKMEDDNLAINDVKKVENNVIEIQEENNAQNETNKLDEEKNNVVELQKKLEVERLEKLNKRKEVLAKTIDTYSTLNLDSKSNLNCNELNPVLPGMTANEKKLAEETTKKCLDIKMKARKELQKIKSGFKISDCKTFITEREKRFEEFNKTQKIPDGVKLPSKEERQQFIEQEIETCEIGYALQENNCNLLNSETKKQKCEKFNELKQEKRQLEQLLNFKKEDYIR